ncbi:Alpha [Echinococcus multilocularis]|uniref:Alpha n=1 Tax=Echinococcus multilocularis TaxID=6211 RepID=A0A068XT21_ECHMU|nr:Alpha [Echinococcus multilocularis]
MLLLADYFTFDEHSVKYIISGLLGAYTAYYIFAARSPPVLYGHSRKLVDFFCSYVPFLSEVYSPFVFGFTGRVQTILRPIFHRAEKCNYEEEVISFSDGGDMTLSWSNIEGMASDTPIAVLLPGLTGCGCCHYIASLVKEINRCKYRCVVPNNRGTCHHKLKTPRTYCAAHTSDVASVFEHIRNRYPDAPMVAVGISLGALLVFNYLADEPQDPSKPCPLTAAMCVCMPWDVSQTSDKLEKSLDWLLFNYPLTHGLRRLIMRNADVLSKKYDVPRILKSRSVREFDENLTVDMFGYTSVDEYYAHASPATKIDRVRIPILCLNAADDPFVPFHTLPMEAVNAAGCRVVLALTRHGGHIGFLDGFLPTGPSLLDRAVPQFVSAVFQHPEDFAVAIAAATDDAVADTNVESEGGESNSRKETTATFY